MPAERRLFARWQRVRLTRLLIAVVVTVPLVASAIYMWAMWDPTRKVDQLPVAVVNADQPVGAGEDRVSAGADVTAKLLATGALDFHTVSADRARQGLIDGDYYFVISIPRDFSSTLAGIGDATIAPALITVSYNDNTNLKASSIGSVAVGKISAAVLSGVATGTVSTVLDGVNRLGDGLTRAADGSRRLSDGTSELAGGTTALRDGVATQLAPGARSAADGGARLAAGASELAAGTVRLQEGTDRLGDGANQVADGIERLTGIVDVAALQRVLEQVRPLLASTGSAGTITSGLDRVGELLDGLQRLETGSRQIATELSDPAAAYRSGVNQVVAGTQRLQQGSTELSAGLQRLDAGTQRVEAGAQRVEDGARQVDDGAEQLSDGLAKGIAQVPDLGDSARQESLAKLVATPIATKTDYVARAQFFGAGGAPTFLIVGSALITIIVLMCLRGRRFVIGDDRQLTISMFARRVITACAASLGIIALLGLVVWNVLTPTPQPESLPRVIIAVIAATLMNAAVFALLFVLLDYVAGALASLSWLMLQLFSYGGVWMVETVPAPFRWLHPLSPMTYVRDSITAAFSGSTHFVPATTLVILIGVAAVVATATVITVKNSLDGSPATSATV